MNAVIITPQNASEMKFLLNLLDKLGIASQAISVEQAEDMGMSVLMKKVDRTKKVSREAVMKKLNRK